MLKNNIFPNLNFALHLFHVFENISDLVQPNDLLCKSARRFLKKTIV